MDTKKLKQEIHQLVDQVKPSRLKAYKELLELEVQGKGDFWDELTEEQRSAIDEAIAQLDRGEGYSYKEIRQEIRDKHGF